MSTINGKIVLITGGANGIGKIMGEKCLQEGAKALVIWDINQINLDKTTAELKAKNYNVYPYNVDVSDAKDIQENANRVLNEVGVVDILINNAGIVVGKMFKEHTSREVQKTLDINIGGVMNVTLSFLNPMILKGEGHIVNIASASSYTPNPKMSVYAASKWAVLGWSESLRLELKAEKGNLRVSTILPGYIDTGMFKGVKQPLLTPVLQPEYIAQKIVNAIKYNKVLVQSPWTVRLVPMLRGILPLSWYDFVARNIFGVYGTMSDFVGRPKEEAVPEKETAKIN
ncbi:MAG: SDR family NAD(P)-dependent oxidoreductase [Bacteroidetes bacterium]|nr:MAG: SDR family NAD(P)-dependent oxidoreductase [Bacteroidota bacterium]